MNNVYMGIDIGSTTVKVVLLDQERNVLAHRYQRSRGQPRQMILQLVQEIAQEHDLSPLAGVGLTGSGGEPVARLIGGRHVNELVAQTRSVGEFYPEVRTVIEIGGQDSKFLSLEWDTKSEKMVLIDFAMNSLCAAGTGSFLDQQAERLGISIEHEFAEMALQSENPARIAGRCTVFAKSDMIHLQQKGTPLSDILAGLCMALARNFKSVIGKGKSFVAPMLIQGGVAYNAGVVRAFETLLNLQPGQLIVPQYHWLMAALGTAFITMDDAADGTLIPFRGFEYLDEQVRSGINERKYMPSLRAHVASSNGHHAVQPEIPLETALQQRLPVYVGIDVGSISTNVVLIDEQQQLVARRYLHTEGRPLEAVRYALHDIQQKMGDSVDVCGVGTTGSGRYLTADFVGADVVCNEITAQARAAIAIDPTVKTIFEIGGQDSKYISLHHGAVVDFAMNNACAAGTGSFLEEQADRLQIDIKEDFSRLALDSDFPGCLGDRCTVFMESDIVHHQQQGAQVQDLTAGLAYAIVQNYLNRVVNGRPIGDNVFFQGGVAWNQSVVAAFREMTGRAITVPPNHDVTGAIGAALLAMEDLSQRRSQGDAVPTRFKGFDLGDRSYQSAVFECKACPNLCEVNRVTISGEPPIFYGARCDRFEEAGRTNLRARDDLPDLFAERKALLMGTYQDPANGRNGRPRVAMPRALLFYDLFPYWRTFFDVLGMELVLSEATNPRITRQALEAASAESCFPAKLIYGHVLDLLNKEADFLFLPGVINRDVIAPGQVESNYCPYIPASSYLVAAGIDLEASGIKPVIFPFHMLWSHVKERELLALAPQFGVSRQLIRAADKAAMAAQQAFYDKAQERGQEILHTLPEDQPLAVIVGRPYNTYDTGVCQDLPYKLRKLGVLALPMDFLPLRNVDLSDEYNKMYWRSGQDILAAAKLIQRDPRLQAIYVTSFSCGPDSFILSFFRRILGEKPFLELEMDEHTADAGIITRCEAFFDSLEMAKGAVL